MLLNRRSRVQILLVYFLGEDRLRFDYLELINYLLFRGREKCSGDQNKINVFRGRDCSGDQNKIGDLGIRSGLHDLSL